MDDAEFRYQNPALQQTEIAIWNARRPRHPGTLSHSRRSRGQDFSPHAGASYKQYSDSRESSLTSSALIDLEIRKVDEV